MIWLEIFLMAALNAIIDTMIVLVILSRRQERMMGVAKVENDEGEIIYAPLDPDGKPMKVPVARTVDGKTVVQMEYVGLAWALPQIVIANMKASLYGKVGNLKQQAEAFAKGELPLETAAQAAALDAFSKGQYGKAIANLILPSVVNGIRSNRIGLPGANAGQGVSGQGGGSL